jgi:hypothetical protein
MATTMEMIMELREQCIESGNKKYGNDPDANMDFRYDLESLVSDYIYNPFDVVLKLRNLLAELEEA